MNVLFAANEPHVSLPAETIFHIGSFPVTNSLITGALAYGLLLWMMFYVARSIKRSRKNRFVSLVQWIFESLYETVQQVTNDAKLTRKLAPLSISIFLFILIQYWFGILPFVGEAITWHEIPLFRGGIADLNVTFALAIVTIVMAQVYAIRALGIRGNLGRYFRNPIKDPAGSFEGILELIAEFSRLMGLSFRLFGNVFAGEILLMMIGFLTVYASPATLPPFYIFELFIGAIQAYIFFMLTTVFISLGVAHGHHDDNHKSTHSHPDVPQTATVGNVS